MKLTIEVLDSPLSRPFTISRGAITSQRTVIVRLETSVGVGYGEVNESDYYGHSVESIVESIESVRSKVESCSLTSGDQLWRELHETLAEDLFALSALDIAAHDLYSKSVGRCCYETLGLSWSDPPASSLTLSVGTPDQVVEEFKLNPGWGIYKLKLGTAQDLEVVAALREHTDAVIRIDANCAWSSRETVDKSQRLLELGVEFIEQPLPPDAPPSEHAWVLAESALPIIADENCCVPTDVRRCVGFFHGVNIKLCKCGGLTPAVQMLREARSLGLRTMVGCMVESSIGISASAQLLPLLDYCDLDGALLLASDPAVGVSVEQGVISLPRRSGCGGILRDDSLPAVTERIPTGVF